jgi:hypothetical protein
MSQTEIGLRVTYGGSREATFEPESEDERRMLEIVAGIYAEGRKRCEGMPLSPYGIEIADAQHITLPVDKSELVPLSAFLTDAASYGVCDVRSTMALLLAQAWHGAFTGLMSPTRDVLFYKPREPVSCSAYMRTFAPAYLCCILPLHGYHPFFDAAAGSGDSTSYARGFVRALSAYIPIMPARAPEGTSPLWELIDALNRDSKPCEVDWPKQACAEHLVNLAVDAFVADAAADPVAAILDSV